MRHGRMSPNSGVRYKVKQMTAQEVRTHIGYSGWASRKVLEAALALPSEDRIAEAAAEAPADAAVEAATDAE